MATGMNRSAVGFWQRLESRFAALLPRQAYVVRTEGSTVWVRFAGEAATAPASQFPTTVSGLGANTTGWVYPVGGGKGLFVATGGVYTQAQVDALIAANKPRVKRSWTGGVNPTTAGDYAVTSGAGPITFTGLTASASYELQWSVSFPMFAFAAARMYPGVRVTDNGGSSFHFFTGGAPDLNPATAGGETIVSWDYSATVTASGIGEVAICPAVRWVSGSPYAGVTTFAATISRA